MDVRALIVAAVATAAGSGCAGTSLWKEKPKVPEGIPTAALSPSVKPEANPVVQASAFSQVASAPSTISTTVAKMTGSKPVRQPAVSLMTMWRNKIDYLPDPSNNGEMGAGLAGQMFLFGPTNLPVPADGKLIVALYDETPRPAGQPANKPEGWAFDKETLRKLVTMDERFGKSFTIFLPWPTYRPDVTKIRIAARYEPEHGDVLYAAETKITLDNSMAGAGAGGFGGGAQVLDWSSHPGGAGAGSSQPSTSFSPLGGPPPVGGGNFRSGPMGAGAGFGAGNGFGGVSVPPPNFGSVPQAPPGAFPNAPRGGVPAGDTGVGMPANFGGVQSQPGQVGPQGPPPGLPSLSLTVPPLTGR